MIFVKLDNRDEIKFKTGNEFRNYLISNNFGQITRKFRECGDICVINGAIIGHYKYGKKV